MNSCSGGLSGMDFGMMNFVGSAGCENGGTSLGFSYPETGNKVFRSGFLKQERSESGEENERGSKMARTDDFIVPKPMLHQQTTTHLLRSNSGLAVDDAQHMLSFSSVKTEVPFLSANGGEKATQTTVFPLFQQPSAYGRAAGYASGGLNAEIHGPFSRFRGPFTPSQWMELEHQALIYKHIVANVPIPPNLLIPPKKSFNPYAFSGLSCGSYNSNSLGWGSFHLGYSGNADPEPGRCRRTDGKKWRCSRDAVPEQKYCERHINRGRHRSRKPVEGQTGRAVSGSTAPKVAPIASPTSAAVISSSGTSNSLGVIQHQYKNFQPGAASFPTDALLSRNEDPQGLISSSDNFKSKGSLSSIQKPHDPFEESPHSKFGLVSSDPILSSSQSTLIDSKTCNSFLNPGNQHPLLHFIDDWPKDQSERVNVAWPEELKSDWTQLSISIPTSTTSNSSQQEKLSLSPLRMSNEFDPIKMGLGMCHDPRESIQRQANWVPISWGNSVGGPLGEVLNNTSSNLGASKNPSAINHHHMTEVSNGSPQFGSSPTGVLQKATFVSLSNSSSESSPRAEKKVSEGASICNDVLGSLASSSSIPTF